jgi:hypothetical protein
MDRMHGPTSAVLVGATFVCFCLMMMASATDYKPDVPDALGEVMTYHSHFIHHSPTFEPGRLQLSDGNLILPWATRLPQASAKYSSDLMPHSPPTKEEIILTGSNFIPPSEDLTSMKSVKRRDNNLENIERIVDAKLKSCLNDNDRRDADKSRASAQRLGNNMDIVVSGISVRAINTVPGGNAMATSNIVIKPVQIIVCPPEIEEKLK